MNILAKFPLAPQVDYEIFNFIMCRRGQLRSNMQQGMYKTFIIDTVPRTSR